MPNIKVIYNAKDIIDDIVNDIEGYINDGNSAVDEKSIKNKMDKLFQSAFEEGRVYQKYIDQSKSKDGLIFKSGI